MDTIFGWAILGIVIIAGVVAGIFGREGRRWVGWTVAGLATIVEVIVVITSMMVTINSSDIGVITSFGKPTGDLTPGVHWLAPTTNVTTWDGAVQDITYTRDDCLHVHIGGQQTACLAVTLQYQVKPSAVDDLFRRFRTQSNMNSLLVTRSLDQAINDQLASFSPIQAVATAGSNGDSLVPYQTLVLNQMKSDIGNSINVESVFMPFITYDGSTTSRLNSLQTQIADTLIANEAIKTAIARATALKDLQQSAVTNPNAIAELCFQNVMEPIVKAGGNPAGIACWQGGSAPSVVISK